MTHVTATTVRERVKQGVSEQTNPPVDVDSREWLVSLRADGSARGEAEARLHALLLRAARFELGRRAALASLSGAELDDLAAEAADDALVGVLGKLDDFRGLSRFTTWAYKFAVYEAAVKARKRVWRDREIPLEPAAWEPFASSTLQPQADVELRELVAALSAAIGDVLTPHQRRVLVAITLDGVPIDVLAERLSTTRGALYKTLHDARKKLREHLADRGFSLELEDR
ncbi:MAG TPA: sigma-70 family RNA polymerase sigma factor [Gaiellaceae bacterium]